MRKELSLWKNSDRVNPAQKARYAKMEKETTAAPVNSQIRRETQLIASNAKKDGSHLRAMSAINVKLARFHPIKRMLVSSVHLDSTLTRVHRRVTIVL